MIRLLTIAALPLALAACLGGRDLPPTLATLSTAAPAPASIARTASPENSLTIEMPVVPQALSVTRVPVHVGPTAIAYVEDVVWVDRPATLFQQLLAETVTRMTGRVVLDPRQALIDPGTRVTGTLQHFGYHADTGEVVVVYDAALNRGDRVESRRFEARRPADGTAATVPQALNVAANEVAAAVADWLAR
ncbi:ABC-type transport auxiliary lipoprotein family protein [Sphingomicrobium lutaoense]|uniref:Cholesterol transport system auxiliary component n=1 Tax=Sphingomicrobium lutaoense TaxID=515949 RepID=A0A839Z1I0_9SPHN|nr:ABC-type transport auxiliary lipoprotein family protein [Sphingomicrobium lutaoense]MBB3764530.1 cholesterol transport system auxiliary component [Sphingomicrobium lutaoense]